MTGTNEDRLLRVSQAITVAALPAAQKSQINPQSPATTHRMMYQGVSIALLLNSYHLVLHPERGTIQLHHSSRIGQRGFGEGGCRDAGLREQPNGDDGADFLQVVANLFGLNV